MAVENRRRYLKTSRGSRGTGAYRTNSRPDLIINAKKNKIFGATVPSVARNQKLIFLIKLQGLTFLHRKDKNRHLAETLLGKI